MEDTHARAEEERALDSSRLRSSARLGFGATASTTAAAAAAVAATAARISRRKRKKKRRQRRQSNDDAQIETEEIDNRQDSQVDRSSENSYVDGDQSKNVQDDHLDRTRSSGARLPPSSSNEGQDNIVHTRRPGKQTAKKCANANAGRRSSMTMDLQRLINEVHARPAIWDQKNVSYHNRDVILELWREIARACEVSTDVAKSKWKHLRDNFRNELKKTYRGKCEGGVSEHDSKWVWFRSLFFLRDQMNSRVIGCALSQNCTNNMHSSPEGAQIEPQIDILEGHEEKQFDDLDGDSCQSMISNDDGLHQVMPPPKMHKVSRKRTLMDTMDNDYTESDRKRYESVQKRLTIAPDEEDDTYHFLMSVKNPLRSLPVDRQMFVRLKIQELVYNEINLQNQQGQAYESTQDVKPPRNGNGSSGNWNNSTGEIINEVSSPAALLQNCTEASNDGPTFFA